MPLLKHAKKKLRQDKKRTADNLKIKNLFKKLIKKAKADPTTDTVAVAFQAIDKAAKKNVIHENKAARLKSSLSKVASGGKGMQTPARKSVSAKAKAMKTKKMKAAKKKSTR